MRAGPKFHLFSERFSVWSSEPSLEPWSPQPIHLCRSAVAAPGKTVLDAPVPRADVPGAAEHSWEDGRAGPAVAALHRELDLCAGKKTPVAAHRFGTRHSP